MPPIERVTQRNEVAIKQWAEQRWPAIKKKPSRTTSPSTGRDEAGFYLLPMRVAQLGTKGPDANPAGAVDARSSDLRISGITFDGRLFMQVRLASNDAATVVGFLRVLLRKISGKLVVSLL